LLVIVASIILLLVMISIIVSFHEYGHYSVARLFNTRIERFSVGFGKILWRRRDKRGTEWAISALPLGGYVKFAGDENIASMVPGHEELEAARAAITEREGAAAVTDYFHFKPLWQRFLIILAGPVFNFILAILIFSLINVVVGSVSYTPLVQETLPGMPAQAAGFKPGDLITSVDGKATPSVTDVVRRIALRADTPTKVVVERNHQLVTLTVTPKRGTVDTGDRHARTQGGVIGLKLGGQGSYHRDDPVSAVIHGTQETWDVLDTNLTYIGRIFTGKENGDQVTGVIGMTKVTSDAVKDVAAEKQSLLGKSLDLTFTCVQLIAFISIGVGFVNLLPVPILDGGHLVFYLIQSVTKKPVPGGIQTAAFPIAVALIVGLMLFAGWNDINHTGLAQYIGRLFS
jgi:regulator of sigma E protease